MANGERSGVWMGLNELQLAYALFRITLGVNILGHGLVRLIYFGIGGLDPWVAEQAALFEGHLLPMWLVHAFLNVLPFIEVVLGVLTALGLFTMPALVAGTLMMFVLVFGNLTRQAWGTVGNNMHYVLYYCLLIAAIRYNCVALDTRSKS
jgi:thiosulfate dehydrogenase [quinone] large subunit